MTMKHLWTLLVGLFITGVVSSDYLPNGIDGNERIVLLGMLATTVSAVLVGGIADVLMTRAEYEQEPSDEEAEPFHERIND
jgi:hypothetical protein